MRIVQEGEGHVLIAISADGFVADRIRARILLWQAELVRAGCYLPWGVFSAALTGASAWEEVDRRLTVHLPIAERGAALDRVLTTASQLDPSPISGCEEWIRRAHQLGEVVLFQSLATDGAEVGARDKLRAMLSATPHSVVLGATRADDELAQASGSRSLIRPTRVEQHCDFSGPVVDPRNMSLDEALRLVDHVQPRTDSSSWPDPASDRVQGLVAGAAVGDALGTEISARPFPRIGPRERALIQDFRDDRRPGPSLHFSDDTVQLLTGITAALSPGALGLHESSLRAVGRIGNPRGGNQTFAIKTSGRSHVPHGGHMTGSTLRSVGATLNSSSAQDACFDALKVASVTHADIGALWASVLVAVSSWAVVREFNTYEVLEIIEMAASLTHLTNGGAVVEPTSIRRMVDDLRGLSDEAVVRTVVQRFGVQRRALSCGLSGLLIGLTASSLREALPVIVDNGERGADLDSTAAIAGALIGARAPSTVPRQWFQALCDAEPSLHSIEPDLPESGGR